MTERRLVIDPQDIQHVEIRCSECEAANLMPVRDPEPLAQFRHPELPGEFNVFTQCFSCGRAFNPPIGKEIRALVRALAGLRGSGNRIMVQLVAKDVQPTATSGP